MNMDHPHVIKNLTGYNIVLDDDNVSIISVTCDKKAFNWVVFCRFPPRDQIFIKSAIVIHTQAVIRVTRAQHTAALTP